MTDSLDLLPLAAAAAVILTATFFIRRYLRLRHIPGPFLASFSDLWLANKYWTGTQYRTLIQELHAKYGPVVRWGPTRVSFASPASIQEIYLNKPVFPKAEAYSPLTLFSNGKEIPSILAIRDEKRVSTIKRHMTGGFSQASFLKQEPQIDHVLVQFLDALKKVEDDVIPISTMLRWWSFDTINRVAFSDDLGFLKAGGTDIGGVFLGARLRFERWKTWYALPKLERLIYKNPIVSRLPSSNKNILVGLAMKRVQERQNDDEKALDKDLIGRFLAANRNHPEAVTKTDVLGLTISTIHAGSDTTAASSTMVLVNLLRTPKALSRLQEEIIAANLPVPPPFEQINSLPYLEASIQESMRVLSISPSSHPRQVPAEGATICGVWIPGGTEVSPSLPNIEMSSEIFGSNPELFQPERWLDADEKTSRSMEKHMMAFSKGSRICTGQHLAKIEMKKLFAALLTTWNVSQSAPGKVSG